MVAGDVLETDFGIVMAVIFHLQRMIWNPIRMNYKNNRTAYWRCVRSFLVATRVYKPGSVLTAIYLGLQLLAGSSRLLGTVGQTYVFLHGVASG